MAELDPGPQRDLIRGYIDKARLNWAHVGIGSLVANGYVDRLLTTNFDPLIAQGCAVFNEFPAVYDLTMSPTMRFEQLPDKAVFHLHGQRNGFSLLNDPHELAQHRQVVEPLFQHAREGRTWIVCGYSGENDPLFELIQQNQRYDYALYWIGREKEAPPHVQKFMGDADRTRCHYLQFAGADEFFVQLSNALGHFPPPFMNDPLGHVAGLLERFTEFPVGAMDGGLDLLTDAKNRIKAYQNQIDGKPHKTAEQEVVEVLAAGDAISAATLLTTAMLHGEPISASVKASVEFALGVHLFEQAQLEVPPNSGTIYRQAAQAYGDAIRSRPDMYEAHNNLGVTLHEIARASSGNGASDLWLQAFKNFEAAIKLHPNMFEALSNWGLALDHLARQSEDAIAFGLWRQAFSKYEEALKIKPDSDAALSNWALALDRMARRTEGQPARELWRESFEKSAMAVSINPKNHRALDDWAASILTDATSCEDSVEIAKIVDEAFSLATRAYAIDMSSGAYNAACAQARRRELASMVEWLDRAVASGDLPNREHLAKDSDFDGVRDTPEYKAWLAKIGWA